MLCCGRAIALRSCYNDSLATMVNMRCTYSEPWKMCLRHLTLDVYLSRALILVSGMKGVVKQQLYIVDNNRRTTHGKICCLVFLLLCTFGHFTTRKRKKDINICKTHENIDATRKFTYISKTVFGLWAAETETPYYTVLMVSLPCAARIYLSSYAPVLLNRWLNFWIS